MKEQMTAAVFPGQGTQRSGMGKDFYHNVRISRDTYEEAAEALGWDVAALCFGPDEKIHLTEYAQPCILTTEMAMFRCLETEYGFTPSFFGGHSLGEYTALVAAGAIPFSEALKIVQSRGQLMQRALPPGKGNMAAVISEDLNLDLVMSVLKDLPMDVANINSAAQIVISGQADSMDTVEGRLKKIMAKEENQFRFVPLNVSAPFHSRFMSTIKDIFREVLDQASESLTPSNAQSVTSNYSGGFHSNSTSTIIENLVCQLSSPVKWRDNMKALSDKVQHIYEIGPNRPLRNFFRSMGTKCRSITTHQAAEREFSAGKNDNEV